MGLTSAVLDDYAEFVANETLLLSLWARFVRSERGLDGSPALRQALAVLFEDVQLDRISKLTALKPLEDLLETVGGKLLRFGSASDPAVVANSDVVFLDLYLSDGTSLGEAANAGEISAADRARSAAISFLSRIRNATITDYNARTPAFVLISSQGSDEIAEDFRKSASQLASRFRFVRKQALAENQPHALMAVADILRTAAASSFLDPIRKATSTALTKARTWIEDRVIDLTIADFGRLYHLSLETEGQRVDEYVKELLAAAFAERMAVEFSRLELAPPNIDALKRVSHYFDPPSNGFADLYSASRIASTRAANVPDPLPQSGDLYLHGRIGTTSLVAMRVSVVMSPACDLMDRVGAGPATDAVLLLEGVVGVPTFRDENDPQIVAIGGRHYEIDWQWKRPRSLPIRVLRECVRRRLRTWFGRLKGEHFLALQGRYLSTFARVGLMKSPRTFELLAGDISAKAGDSRVQVGIPFNASNSFAYMSADPKAPMNRPIGFTGMFVEHLWLRLIETQRDDQLPATLRQSATRILERIELVQQMIETQSARVHSSRLQGLLAVEVVESTAQASQEQREGVLVVRLWRP